MSWFHRSAKPSVVVPDPEPMQLTLRAQIRDITPTIWRTLVVPNTLTLDGLHLALQVAFGWENYHLYEFANPQALCYCPDDPEESFFSFGPKPKSTALPLSEMGLRSGAVFGYLYDIGDSWVTDLAVVSRTPLPATRDSDLPSVIGGERAGPPEDSGGPWGYADKLTVLARGSGEEYEDVREWIGDGFDPERFNIAEVNQRLRVTFRPTARTVRPSKSKPPKKGKPTKKPRR